MAVPLGEWGDSTQEPGCQEGSHGSGGGGSCGDHWQAAEAKNRLAAIMP